MSSPETSSLVCSERHESLDREVMRPNERARAHFDLPLLVRGREVWRLYLAGPELVRASAAKAGRELGAIADKAGAQGSGLFRAMAGGIFVAS